MKIRGTSIRSLSKVLNIAAGKVRIRLVVPLEVVEEELLLRLGFDATQEVGDLLTPSPIGKFTSFNTHGREIVRDDLPMEPRSIMYYGTSRDWHGGLHYGVRSRTTRAYPRQFIPGPSEILHIIEVCGKPHIGSAELRLTDQDETRNIHVCNMMLECFSEFEIVDSDSGEIVGPALKRLQWEILPKGQYPWDISRPIIRRITDSLDQKEREVIEYRMRIIARRNPDFLALGRAGFSGYFVYGFESKKVYVLESIHLDNATYIFNSEWEALSQLSKGQIISSELPHQRIIHNDKWALSVARSIDGA